MTSATGLSVLTIAAAVAAVSLVTAAAASAAPECENTGPTTTLCQRSGSASLSTAPPVVSNPYPFGWPSWNDNSIGLTIVIGDIF